MATIAPAAPPIPRSIPTDGTATYMDAVRSEWTKLRTLRSTYWCLVVAAVLGIGVGALISSLSASHYATDPSVHLGWNPTDRSLRSLTIAQLAFAVLGVIVVTGEYSTGMIRTSLAAVPKRIRMFSAKYLVFTAVVVVAGEIISFVTYLVGQALISGKAPSSSLGDHLVLRAVIGAGLYLALLALVSAAIGTIFRHAAAGIGVIIAILLVLPGVGQALPESWSQPIEKYWPTNAGEKVVILVRDPHTLAAWTGFLDMAVFTALVIVLAWWLLERRDA